MTDSDLKALKHRILVDLNTAYEAARKPGNKDLEPVVAALGQAFERIREVEVTRRGATEETPLMHCPVCNAPMEGDGYTNVLHCPHAHPDEYDSIAPDSNPVTCDEDPWTYAHIIEDDESGQFHAFDEAGLLHSTHATHKEARDALVAYAKTLEHEQ